MPDPEPPPASPPSAQPYAVPLDSPADPAAVVATLRSADRASVFWGRWFGGGLAILVRPSRVEHPVNAADGFGWLDQPGPTAPEFSGLGGGWVTVLGYAAGHSAYALYSSVLRWTAERGWWFESLGLPGHEVTDAALLADWRTRLAAPAPAESWLLGPFRTVAAAGAARDTYLAGVETAIGAIQRGTFYQVNLCTRLHADFTGRTGALFARLVTELAPDYAALVDVGPTTVVSASPELFLRLRDRVVLTAPIKGTAPRTTDPADPGSALLRASVKDAAENIMIVDLMRNDLSRVCQPGTVAVGRLLDVQPHPGVWHLVSTVQGRLRDDAGVTELLRATFPPGSVTGAPKSAAQLGIAALEPESRGAYTGSIGLISPYAGAELNVTIRTLEIADGRASLGVGGGITIDSVPIREWAECLDKAAAVVRVSGARLDPALRPPVAPVPSELAAAGVIETMAAVGSTVLRLAGHLDRLDRSCRELYGAGLPADLSSRIRNAVAGQPPGHRTTVRLLARVEPGAPPDPAGVPVVVGTAPDVDRPRHSRLHQVERAGWCWRHKWADRRELVRAEVAAGHREPGSLPYFVDRSVDPVGTVTESSRGNVFARSADGVWVTPPADDQLLPGVTRRAVIDLLADHDQAVRIGRLSPADLRASAGAFWTSSLSGAVAITAVDGHQLPVATELLDQLNRDLGLRGAPGC